ncbi:IS66 family insertion sequence element accessory protein TnpB [Enterocloster clostridioformis]
MIGDISIKTNLYVIRGYTDMRRSIDGLCAIVQDMFHFPARYHVRLSVLWEVV